MRQPFQIFSIGWLLFTNQIFGLRIATSLQWIEHTPQPYAIKNFYKGSDTATLVSGGVANLATDTTLDLAANAETQGLLQYATHKNLRLIYVIVEVGYRVVANKASGSGIAKLADLKGKKVGTLPGTSAAYFVDKLLGSTGLGTSDYSIVSGNICMKAPCGAGTFPAMITGKQVDAFGIWEPAVQLGANALGTNAVLFQNTSIYREVYSLYSTTDKLADATTRKDIVAFLKALNQTLDVFTNKPDTVYSTVAQAVGMDEAVVEQVWPVHKWSGDIPSDLADFMALEDQYLAAQSGRAAMTQADLANFIDATVLADALKS